MCHCVKPLQQSEIILTNSLGYILKEVTESEAITEYLNNKSIYFICPNAVFGVTFNSGHLCSINKQHSEPFTTSLPYYFVNTGRYNYYG